MPNTPTIIIGASVILIVLMVLAIIGILVRQSLPLWLEDRQNFYNDIGMLFAASFFIGIAFTFLSFMGMLMAATHEQADICLYTFLGGLIYTVVTGVVLT